MEFTQPHRNSNVPGNIRHEVLELSTERKSAELYSILQRCAGEQTLVLFKSKNNISIASKHLMTGGIRSGLIRARRGNKRIQWDKDIKVFNSGEISVIFGTFKTAEQCNIRNIEHIINFDLPFDLKEFDNIMRYVITRATGRNLHVTTFFTDLNKNLATKLATHLSSIDQQVPRWLQDYAKTFGCSRITQRDSVEVDDEDEDDNEKDVEQEKYQRSYDDARQDSIATQQNYQKPATVVTPTQQNPAPHNFQQTPAMSQPVKMQDRNDYRAGYSDGFNAGFESAKKLSDRNISNDRKVSESEKQLQRHHMGAGGFQNQSSGYRNRGGIEDKNVESGYSTFYAANSSKYGASSSGFPASKRSGWN